MKIIKTEACIVNNTLVQSAKMHSGDALISMHQKAAFSTVKIHKILQLVLRFKSTVAAGKDLIKPAWLRWKAPTKTEEAVLHHMSFWWTEFSMSVSVFGLRAD